MKKYALLLIFFSFIFFLLFFIFREEGNTTLENDEEIILPEKINLIGYGPADLKIDKQKMWKLEVIVSPNFIESARSFSPNSSINAAQRVFEFQKDKMIGTFQELLELIGHGKLSISNDGVPFISESNNKTQKTIRFSNKYFSVQYKILFNTEQKITNIEKKFEVSQ